MRFIIHFASSLFTLCAPLFSLAAEPGDFVVKVISERPQQGVSVVGSGLLFRSGAQAYILTSEHVVLHDNLSLHRALLDSGGSLSASYVTADWAIGLALLKAQLPASHQVPTLDELLQSLPSRVGENAMVVGFPGKSISIFADIDGKVDAVDHESSVLVDIPRMIEVRGAHGEFGMSGGAVLNENLNVIGLLSHETPDSENKILYVIPILQAARWAQEVIQTPDFKPYLIRTFDDMVNSRVETVRSQTLRFRLSDYAFDINATTVEIKGLPKTEMAPTRLFPGAFLADCAARVSPYLDGVPVGYHPRVVVTGFRQSTIRNGLSKSQVSNLVNFFRALKNESIRPEAYFEHAGQSPQAITWDLEGPKTR